MCFEVGLDSSYEGSGFEFYESLYPEEKRPFELPWNSVLKAPSKPVRGSLALSFDLSHTKTQMVAQTHRIMPMGSFKGEVGGTVKWGGEDGPQASGYVSGSASDDHGNTAEVIVEVDSDGSGSASAKISHEETTSS